MSVGRSRSGLLLGPKLFGQKELINVNRQRTVRRNSGKSLSAALTAALIDILPTALWEKGFATRTAFAI